MKTAVVVVSADQVETSIQKHNQKQETAGLTKAHLADLLFNQLGTSKRESKAMVDAFFDLLSERLVLGHDVRISNFGSFQVRTKASRPGRNPRTGEAVPIGERRVVTFQASHKLKAQIQKPNSPMLESVRVRV